MFFYRYCFSVIEFVEDMSLKPFSAQKPYHKRITVTKLQSGEWRREGKEEGGERERRG